MCMGAEGHRCGLEDCKCHGCGIRVFKDFIVWPGPYNAGAKAGEESRVNRLEGSRKGLRRLDW